ncbi:hypothetical protein [Pygmaiobacter massiliensis]|uniref:hypothetical protein n=1 Tax=Pygmaiobacter massiliensis TaxID=1917873 RepID=UPI00289997E1|nr:hypothetical protein [Pygmaiobacter massiliensis]
MTFRSMIWPDKQRSIYDINCSNPIEIKWTKNIFLDYKSMSNQYKIIGHKVLKKVIDSGHDNIKSDTWFLVGVYLMRQSLELGLKSLICRIEEHKPNVQDCFTDAKHNLSKLWNCYEKSNENYLCDEEKQWLEVYLGSLEEVDEKSDMFRFPFDNGFLEKYRNKFLDNIKIANNLIYASNLVDKCIECGTAMVGKLYKTFVPDFFIFANHGIGNCYLWQGVSDSGFHTKVTGYTEVANYLFSEIDDENIADYFFPLMFILRNTVELCLKRLFYTEVERGMNHKKFFSKRNSHLIKKDLWLNVKPIIIEYANGTEPGDQLNIIENSLTELSDLDKKGDVFRYPTNYSLEYRLQNQKFDITIVYEFMMACINFLDSCDTMLEVMAEYESEMRSYYAE